MRLDDDVLVDRCDVFDLRRLFLLQPPGDELDCGAHDQNRRDVGRRPRVDPGPCGGNLPRESQEFIPHGDRSTAREQCGPQFPMFTHIGEKSDSGGMDVFGLRNRNSQIDQLRYLLRRHIVEERLLRWMVTEECCVADTRSLAEVENRDLVQRPGPQKLQHGVAQGCASSYRARVFGGLQMGSVVSHGVR